LGGKRHKTPIQPKTQDPQKGGVRKPRGTGKLEAGKKPRKRKEETNGTTKNFTRQKSQFKDQKEKDNATKLRMAGEHETLVGGGLGERKGRCL